MVGSQMMPSFKALIQNAFSLETIRDLCLVCIHIICYLVLVNVLGQLFAITSQLVLDIGWPFIAATPAALVPMIYAVYLWWFK